MDAVSAFLKYSAIRLALFFVPFLLLVAVGWHPLLSGGLSLVFAFCAAYIFFGKQRRELDEALQQAAQKRRERANETGAVRGDDEAAEDAVTAGEDAQDAELGDPEQADTDQADAEQAEPDSK